MKPNMVDGTYNPVAADMIQTHNQIVLKDNRTTIRVIPYALIQEVIDGLEQTHQDCLAYEEKLDKESDNYASDY